MRPTAALLGAGRIGAGWAARLVLMGWDVRVFDPQGAVDLPETLAFARASLPALYDVALPPEGHMTRAATIPEAALAPPAPNPDAPKVPVTLDRQVPVVWVDYNGHMNKAHFVTACSKAADRLLLWAGMDAAAIAAGQSVFSVETHIRYLSEVQIDDRLRVTTRVLHVGQRP